MSLKKVNGEIFLGGRLILCVLFSINLFLLIIFMSSCAKEIRGAGSGAMPQSIASLPLSIMIAPGPEILEERKKFLFGIGGWNLKPSLMVGYLMENSVLGFGISGILFSGLKIDYFFTGADISYMRIGLKGKNSLLGFGGGFGGMYSSDHNFSEEGKSHKFGGGHPYGMVHFYTQAEGSSVGFYVNLRLGYYHYFSTFLKKLVEEIRQEEITEKGHSDTRVKNNFGGLFFTPAIGMVARAIGGKVALIFEVNAPLTAALIFESYLHPYVPSFNFALFF